MGGHRSSQRSLGEDPSAISHENLSFGKEAYVGGVSRRASKYDAILIIIGLAGHSVANNFGKFDFARAYNPKTPATDICCFLPRRLWHPLLFLHQAPEAGDAGVVLFSVRPYK